MILEVIRVVVRVWTAQLGLGSPGWMATFICLVAGRLVELEWPSQQWLIPLHGKPAWASSPETSAFQKAA